jgi:cell division transport system permease protein
VGYFLGEAVTSMRRNRGISSLAVGTIGIALTLLGGFLYVSANFSSVVDRWSREIQLNIYLLDDATDDEIAGLRARLRETPEVEEVRHVSKEEALARFREYFADLSDLPAALEANPLPASLEVRLQEEARSPETVARLADGLSGMPGVEDVQYDTGWVERLDALIRLGSAAGYVVGGLLLLAATFTTSNVIRLALYSRRDEVDILQLVGATRGFIQGPFLVEGLLQGLLGGLLALLLLGAAHLSARAAPAGAGVLMQIATGRFLGSGTILGLLGLGAAMGLTGSFLAVRRFLATEG